MQRIEARSAVCKKNAQRSVNRAGSIIYLTFLRPRKYWVVLLEPDQKTSTNSLRVLQWVTKDSKITFYPPSSDYHLSKKVCLFSVYMCIPYYIWKMLMQGTGKLVLKDHFFLEAIKMASERAGGHSLQGIKIRNLQI